MHSILIHISGIAILEILFYFLYIGPYESDMFKKSFESSLLSLLKSSKLSNKNYIVYNQNDNWNEFIIELKNNAIYHEKIRIDNNNKLFVETLLIWTLLFSISVIIFIGTYLYKKYHIINNRYLAEKESKKNNKLYLLIKYLLLSGIIILFEYIFFKFVVLKYKIVSTEELRYLIMNKLYNYFNN